MNAKQAKNIPLTSILGKLGIRKYKSKGKDIWYFSPFREERTASFKVNQNLNVFYDYGKGKGGNVLDFIMEYYQCDFTTALHIVRDRFNSFSFHQHTAFKKIDANERKKEYVVTTISEISHMALLDYLTIERGLNLKVAKKYCRQVHYSIKGRRYFGIGFKNDLGGYEIRNKYVKLCLGQKYFSLFSNEANSLNIFESWSDFISYLSLFPAKEFCSDYLILNSVSMVNKLSDLNQVKPLIKTSGYNMILATLDNDKAGDRAVEKLEGIYPNLVVDNRVFFQNYKDVNDYLMAVKRS